MSKASPKLNALYSYIENNNGELQINIINWYMNEYNRSYFTAHNQLRILIKKGLVRMKSTKLNGNCVFINKVKTHK